jgi:ankyrin repeat protein
MTLGPAVLAAATHGLSTLKFIVESWKANTSWSGGCEGTTVLHFAALAGTIDTVQYLIDHGMDVNQKDFKGWTAVHYAALSTTPDKLKLLLPYWRPEKTESNRWSPLHLACQRNLPEALDLLSKAGVSPNTVTTSEPQWQWSLYDIASVYQNENLVSPKGQSLHGLLLEGTGTIAELPIMHRGEFRICDGCQFSNVS